VAPTVVHIGLILQNIGIDYENDELTRDALKAYVADAMRDIQQMSATIDDFRNFFRPNKDKQRFLAGDSVEKRSTWSGTASSITTSRSPRTNATNLCIAFGYPTNSRRLC